MLKGREEAFLKLEDTVMVIKKKGTAEQDFTEFTPHHKILTRTFILIFKSVHNLIVHCRD